MIFSEKIQAGQICIRYQGKNYLVDNARLGDAGELVMIYIAAENNIVCREVAESRHNFCIKYKCGKYAPKRDDVYCGVLVPDAPQSVRDAYYEVLYSVGVVRL